MSAVLKWNTTVNLVSTNDAELIWTRHICDSLQLIEFLPPNCTLAADLGSGAGFPGLILAISTGVTFHLVEADKRKAAFLIYVAQLTGAPVIVHSSRIEDCGLRNMDVVTSRALAPLERLLDYAEPMLAPHGMCLFLKGLGVSSEIDQASAIWNMRLRRVGNNVQPGGELLCIDRVSRV